MQEANQKIKVKHGNSRLTMKTEQFRGASVHEVEEEFTPKTCSNCGNIKDDLGSSKIYNSLGCSSLFDIDIIAVKNIRL